MKDAFYDDFNAKPAEAKARRILDSLAPETTPAFLSPQEFFNHTFAQFKDKYEARLHQMSDEEVETAARQVNEEARLYFLQHEDD